MSRPFLRAFSLLRFDNTERSRVVDYRVAGAACRQAVDRGQQLEKRLMLSGLTTETNAEVWEPVRGEENFGVPAQDESVTQLVSRLGDDGVEVIVDFENFDGVAAGSLPAGWATISSNGNLWTTNSASPSSAPNRAFVSNVATAGDANLITPAFAVTTANGRVIFQNDFDTENGFDGGVLEISINGGTFVDIIDAGGTFVAGGYNGTISTGFGSPLAGRAAWTGDSNGYIQTVVDLPQAAVGNNVQLRWRLGTDTGIDDVGWAIDTIQTDALPNEDFGDAPIGYPVTLAENGARHTVGSLFLGASVDPESDGAHSATANGDLGDEDGVTFATGLDGGETETVVVTTSGAGLLQAWFDWNQDGDWNDAGEQVFTDRALAAGTSNLTIDVPASVTAGDAINARFRYSSAGGLGITGLAGDGEVEDYQITSGQTRLIWANRGNNDRFDDVFGANAELARGVVDAVFASWERVITDLNHDSFGGPGEIRINVSMRASGTGFGASAGVTSFGSGFPLTGNVTIARGNDTNGDGNGDGAGFFLDPTPMDWSEFQGTTNRGAFTAQAQAGSPAAGMSDLFTLVNAEITHSIGLFLSPARMNNPISGTVVDTGIPDTAEGGGIGNFWVFDGPSITHLMTSNNGGGGGNDFGEIVHTAGRQSNVQVNFTSAFRGDLVLTGADDPGNAVYSFGQRTLVNDVLALLFQDAYGYTITLPQTFGTVYSFINETTGELILRGGEGGSDDEFDVSVVGDQIRVSVNIGDDIPGTGPAGDSSDIPAFVSFFSLSEVTSVSIDGRGGDDTFTIAPLVGKPITIDGGPEDTADSLVFNVAGVSGINFTDNGDGSGTLTSTSHATVTWTDIENATPPIDPGSPPTVNDATFQIAENSAIGTLVGTVIASDPDAGQTVSYAITGGNGSGAFAINATSGEITVASSLPLNFEATPQFSLTVTVSDDGTPSQSAQATITVDLTDVNETPDINAQSFSVAEDAPNGTAVGIVQAVDPDTAAPFNTLTFSLTGGGGAFSIDSATGQLLVANTAILDATANPTVNLTVTVTDGGTPGLADTAIVTVSILPPGSNNPPTLTYQPVVTSLPENTDTSADILVGLVVIDDDGIGQNNLSLTGDDAALFRLVGTQVFLRAGTPLSSVTNPALDFVVNVDDTSVGNTPDDSEAVTITVTPIQDNQPPRITYTAIITTLPENADVSFRRLVGTFQILDDGVGFNTVGLQGADFSLFEIVGNDVFLRAGANLDAVGNPTLDFTLNVDDATVGGTPDDFVNVQITVTPGGTNSPPTLENQFFTMTENTPAGTVIGRIVVTDPNPGQTFRFFVLGGSGDNFFSVDFTSGEIRVVDESAMDFEVNPQLTLIIEVFDNGFPSFSDLGVMTIDLLDVNDTPRVADDSDAVYSRELIGWRRTFSVDPLTDTFRAWRQGPTSGTATWTFAGVPDGTYQIAASWVPGADRAQSATYTVRNGGNIVAQSTINQVVPPTDLINLDGKNWSVLGTATVVQGTVTVTLSGAGAGLLIADGFRLDPIVPTTTLPASSGSDAGSEALSSEIVAAVSVASPGDSTSLFGTVPVQVAGTSEVQDSESTSTPPAAPESEKSTSSAPLVAADENESEVPLLDQVFAGIVDDDDLLDDLFA